MKDRSPAPPPPRIEAVEHVHVEVPHGREPDLTRFYGRLLGLATVPAAPPAVLAFGTRKLHLNFVPCERPRVDPHRRRCCLEIRSLADCRRRLEDARFAVWTLSGLSLTDRRLFATDPTGHVVELRQYWPL